MRNNKQILILRLIVLSLFCIGGFACSGDKQKAANTAGQTYTFVYANTQSKEHPRSQSMLLFKDLIEKSSQGRIKVELHFSGILGKEEEVLDMVKQGIIQGCRSGLFERANKKYIIYTLPFLFKNVDEVLRVLDSDFGKSINREALANGYYIPACGVAGGFRNITNNKRPINSPLDIKGLKLRAPPLDITIKTFTALEAAPQQITYTDTYLALREGIVDGQENPFSNIVDMKFDEVQKYLSIINWQIHPDPFYVNPAWYGALPEDLKNVFDAAARETIETSNKLWLESENNYLNRLKARLIVNTPPAENIGQFTAAVAPVWEYYIARGNFSREDIETVRKIIGK
jgi:C4-dicarboxylate-binding protein DctP